MCPVSLPGLDFQRADGVVALVGDPDIHAAVEYGRGDALGVYPAGFGCLLADAVVDDVVLSGAGDEFEDGCRGGGDVINDDGAGVTQRGGNVYAPIECE